jgi:hypothetical protein
LKKKIKKTDERNNKKKRDKKIFGRNNGRKKDMERKFKKIAI